MVLTISIALCLTMAALILTRPVGALLLYGITATYADGFAVSQWLGGNWFQMVMNFLFAILFAFAVFRLLGRSRLGKSEQRVAVACIAAIAWCLISLLVRGDSILGAFSIIPYLALPYVVVWIAFADRSDSTRSLLRLIILQTAIAVIVLVIPGMDFLRGDMYGVLPASEGGSTGLAGWVLPSGSTSKGLTGNHYGQFHNPNVLGFYATAAILVGAFLLIRKRPGGVFAGISVVVAGVFLWLNSLTRGPMLGLIVMLVIALGYLQRTGRDRMRSTVAPVVGFVAVLFAYTVLELSGVLDYLVPSGGDISVSTRLEGYSEALRVIGSSPVFGKELTYEWPLLARPHFVGLLFGADYGLIAGVFITWLVFCYSGMVALRVLMSPRVDFGEALLTAGAFGINGGIAATNNFAGPLLFGALMGHIIIMGRVERNRATENKVEGSSVVSGKVYRAGPSGGCRGSG